jgi:hypothetical protein
LCIERPCIGRTSSGTDPVPASSLRSLTVSR